MKNIITKLNHLYQPSLEKIEQIRKILLKNGIDHAILFSNNHHIKIDDKIESVQYPIPNIVCKLDGIQTKIGIDLAENKNYIGFVKFSICKDQFNLFKFDAIKHLKFEVYGFNFYQYYSNVKDLNNLKTNITNSTETTLYIKIQVASIEEIISIINNFSTAPQKQNHISSYVCKCGHNISVNSYCGQCPICGEDSPHKRKFKTKCPVCQSLTLKDQFGCGKCENCGWEIDKISKQCKNSVIYPNLISLNKAKKLYQDGKPFKPDLNDFLEGLYFYSEMEFYYKGLNCCVFLTSDTNKKIEFGWSPENVYYFSDKEDFIQNAKINDKFVKDIWDKVENPNYL